MLKHLDLKRDEIEAAIAELDRLVEAAEEAYERMIALEDWEDEGDRDPC